MLQRSSIHPTFSAFLDCPRLVHDLFTSLAALPPESAAGAEDPVRLASNPPAFLPAHLRHEVELLKISELLKV